MGCRGKRGGRVFFGVSDAAFARCRIAAIMAKASMTSDT